MCVYLENTLKCKLDSWWGEEHVQWRHVQWRCDMSDGGGLLIKIVPSVCFILVMRFPVVRSVEEVARVPISIKVNLDDFSPKTRQM